MKPWKGYSLKWSNCRLLKLEEVLVKIYLESFIFDSSVYNQAVSGFTNPGLKEK